MGWLFNDPNKKAQKLYDKMIRAGADPNAYKSRKCCENCRYYTSIGVCNIHKGRTSPANVCSEWWGR